jgi:hypothetical protein
MTLFERVIIIKSSDFLVNLKNSNKILKNIKFGLQLDFHIENILTGQIDHLNFKEGETVCSTRVIHATRSIVAKLSLYIYTHATFSTTYFLKIEIARTIYELLKSVMPCSPKFDVVNYIYLFYYLNSGTLYREDQFGLGLNELKSGKFDFIEDIRSGRVNLYIDIFKKFSLILIKF